MQKTLFVYAVFFILIVLGYFLYRNRMSPKILETCVTILLLAIAVVVWQLKPEKAAAKFPFVYFFDHQQGKLINLIVPGLYYPEYVMTLGNEKLLKENLKEDFLHVSKCLAEYMIYKNLERTPFGSKYYRPTKRIVHLWMMSWPSGAEVEETIKVKTITKNVILEKMEDNIFKEFIENPPSTKSHLSISGIKVPSGTKFIVKRNLDKKGKVSEVLISMKQALWFDMEIKIGRGSMGGTISNWSWANQNLQIENKDESKRNDFYESSGEIEIKWELKKWSIGNPEADFYRIWLNAITDRLRNHFDWDLKCQALHIESPFIK